ncbi:MAG: J domain-containing protein [Chloroflexota bacterium]|nr:J domain-containing protein [Chloroflexota bacterium]
MASLARATTKWDGSVEIEFPFNRGLVEALKAEIPSNHREWNPERKVWIVASPWAHWAVGLLQEFFPDATREPASRPTPIRSFDEAYRTLHLLPTAPACVIEAAYRALVREQHPDRKPPAEREQAHESMIALNRAIDVLRIEVAS